jgi:hippurate hydrolase
MDAQMRRIASGIAQTFGVEIDLTATYGYGVTANTGPEGDLAAEACAAAGLKVRRDLAPSMTGEDFARYLGEIPGAFVWVGNGPSAELHNSAYNYNDEILPAAATYLAATAKRALAG